NEWCDVVIQVPEEETYKAQELHLPVYHALCIELEFHFFG
ncbi:MAG: D-sedoheptulose 7-phosphate isomerase, partial [Bacteriovoracaceae bacterium]